LRNTITYAESVLDDDVSAVLGGTHLVAQSREEVVETAAWLADKPALELVAPCHCTGFEAESVLRAELPELFVPVGVGTTLDLESLTFATDSF
jgi:7,8-dihydropterin-6-yl-methyl-4-(beta-D-ribofuranosyl)aminobenzene 5'-phosphate synthase